MEKHLHFGNIADTRFRETYNEVEIQQAVRDSLTGDKAADGHTLAAAGIEPVALWATGHAL